MKKILCIIVTILMTGLNMHAQPKMETSEIFEEPLSEGWTKILMLKNGNTFYMHYGCKKGIEVTVFDKNRKKTNEQRVVSKNWNPKRKILVKISGAYEINGEPVIFVQYFGDVSPVLYRMRLNANTGALVKEDIVTARPKKFFMRSMANMEQGQNVYVEKDPESDNYAVISVNGKEKDIDNRISIMHFDGNHKMINQGTYSSPDNDFKHLNLIGALVDGSKRIYIVTYGAKNKKGGKGHVFIAQLNVGDSSFLNKTLDFTEDFMKTNSDIVYDRKNNRLVMLTNTLAEEKSSSRTYVSFLSFIDPENLAMKGVNILGSEKVNAYGKNVLGIDQEYHGLPQKLELNNDNTVTVLQEEMKFQDVYSSRSGATVAEYTFMGNIGITEIDSTGTERDGYAIMKSQLYYGHIGALYMAGREKGIWTNDIYSRHNSNDNEFMSYEYIHTGNANYVLFCDNPRNDKKDEDDTRRKVTSNVDFMNTICYTIKDGVAKRSYLFGEPERKNNTRACYIEASQYDKKTNTYITVYSEQHGRKYDSRMAWIHFD